MPDRPAERGPSGTGHDTACPKCGMPGAAYSTHVCMTAGEVPDPPATRWLNPPLDPPVAVPGPASPPADPVVSPADTIRRLTEWLDSAPDSFPSYRMHEPTYRNPGDLRRDVRALLAVGERDRRQIARLTEALREVEWNGSAWIGFETCPECSNERKEGHSPECSVGAVLAGEEDARP